MTLLWTIGNLTLLVKNMNEGNYSFAEKKKRVLGRGEFKKKMSSYHLADYKDVFEQMDSFTPDDCTKRTGHIIE